MTVPLIPSKYLPNTARYCVLLLLLLGFWCSAGAQPLEVTGDVDAVHDPVLIEEAGSFYLFSTGRGIPIRCSDNLVNWSQCGAVFFGLPDWIREEVPAVGDLWAPDVSFFDGRYQVYYSASSFGDNRSAIGLATNPTLDPESPDYAWRDEGLVVKSEHSDDWNAIDPNFVVDAGGQPWLAFGSFWSGIKLVELDPETRKPVEDATLHALASRSSPGAVEAPFIVYREPYYYLFVSFDQCCQGVESTYNIRVGRSEGITGPYVDKEGVPMLEGGGTLLKEGGARWKGTGHNAVFHHDGEDYLVYHAYDAEDHGRPYLRLEPLGWQDGWPRLGPLEAER